MPLKIFFVGEQDLIGEGIKAHITNSIPRASVHECDAENLFSELNNSTPHIIILDIDVKNLDGLSYARKIKKNFPGIRLLILSVNLNESNLMSYLDAGVEGYILKNSPKEELIFAIEKIRGGGIYIGPEFTLNLLTKNRLKHSSEQAIAKNHTTLSEREMDVLELIAQGLTNAEMATKLFISIRTIETRRKKILEKTGTTNTATLIRYAVLSGLIK